MSVAKIIEITAQSDESFQDAIEEGLMRAAETIENIEGVWVKDQEVVIKNNQIQAYRVTMKVTFMLSGSKKKSK